MSPLNITQPLDSIRYMVYNGYYKVGRVGHRHDALPSHTCCKQVYSLEQTRFTETCAKKNIDLERIDEYVFFI